MIAPDLEANNVTVTTTKKSSSSSSHEEYRSFDDIKQYLDAFYQIKDIPLRMEYHDFNNQQRSLGFIRYVTCLITLLIAPLQTAILYYDSQAPTSSGKYHARTILSSIGMISAWLCSVACFTVYVDQAKILLPYLWKSNSTDGGLKPSYSIFGRHWTRSQVLLQANSLGSPLAMVSLLTIFIRHAYNLSCGSHSIPNFEVFGGGGCSSDEVLYFNMYLILIIVLSLPSIPASIFPNMPTVVLFVDFFVTCLVVTIVSIDVKKVKLIIPAVLFGLFFYIAAIDCQIRNILVFFANRRLNETLEIITRMEEENRANELRSMITNVAHDLKTPLSSFQTSIHFMQEELSRYWQMLSSDIFQRNKVMEVKDTMELITSLQKCLDSIHSTNAFMLMAINRCVDFTKASKGLILVPTYESTPLSSLFDIPLDCISKVQDRIEIVMEKWPEDICQFVITDKQWMRENILCLLSNAIKFQTSGKVEVGFLLDNPALAPNEDGKKKESRQINHNYRRQHIRKSFHINAETNNQNNTWHLPRLKSNRVLAIDELEMSLQAPRSNLPIGADDSDAFMIVEVEDHSIGMSDAEMLDLFKPYKQHQRLSGGTGLGLYCLAKRVEALNGYYGVESRRDGKRGCLFWFAIPYRPDILHMIEKEDLPASLNSETIKGKGTKEDNVVYKVQSNDHGEINDCDSSVIELQSTVVPKANSTNPNKNNISLSILLVDDSPVIIKLMTMMLEQAGHHVTSAENGEVAVQKVQDRWLQQHDKPDLILMDLQMPVMDGIEATRRLRQFEEQVLLRYVDLKTNCLGQSVMDNSMHLNIVGMSASSNYDIIKSAFEAGVDSFLAKPFQMLDFTDVVKYLIAKKILIIK